MKRIFKASFFLFLLLICNVVLSQEREYIIGKLLDAKTQEPIAFASIQIKDRALGVISNLDGSFKIPIKYKELGDIIKISSMGFQSMEILIHDFSVYEINNVRLQPAILELQEAIVTAKKKKQKSLVAKAIVRKAINAIPKNYPRYDFSTVGYYRDYQLKKGDYINLNEAILEVFDQGFQSNDIESTLVRIYDSQPNMEFERDELATDKYDYKDKKKIVKDAFLYHYGGNEFIILKVHNAIRNYQVNSFDFINKLETDFLDKHRFYKNEEVLSDGEPCYNIGFEKVINGYRSIGKIYISKINYTIYKMEYAMFNNKGFNRNVRLNKRNNNSNKLIFEVTTEYKKNHEDVFLNYISFHNKFQITKPPEFVVNEIIANRSGGFFEVRFNKEGLEPISAGRKSNYHFNFKGKRLKFKEMIVYDDAVRLYPDMTDSEVDVMMRELVAEPKDKPVEQLLIQTKIKNIRCTDGLETHVLNEQKIVNYQQFREFFVQQVKPNGIAPLDSLFMDKRKPIFKDQSIVKPENFDDYWMNTPLQKIDN